MQGPFGLRCITRKGVSPERAIGCEHRQQFDNGVGEHEQTDRNSRMNCEWRHPLAQEFVVGNAFMSRSPTTFQMGARQSWRAGAACKAVVIG